MEQIPVITPHPSHLWKLILIATLTVIVVFPIGFAIGKYVCPQQDANALENRYDDGYSSGLNRGWLNGTGDAREATEALNYSVTPGCIETTITSHSKFGDNIINIGITNRSSAPHKFTVEAIAPKEGDMYANVNGKLGCYSAGDASWFSAPYTFTISPFNIIYYEPTLIIPEYVKDGSYLVCLRVSSPDKQVIKIEYLCKVFITVNRGSC